MKRNNGITLIALVVTIIILLILAGVSITMFSGKGIFARAQSGAEKWKQGEEIENSTIASLIDGFDSEEQKLQLVSPTITIVGESDKNQQVFANDVQVKIIGNNMPVVKSLHYLVDGAEAKSDTEIQNNQTFSLSAAGRITIKAYSVGWDNQKSAFAEREIIISKAPPEYAVIEITGDTEVQSLPTTVKAKVTHISEYNDIDISNCKYVINNSGDDVGTDKANYTNTFTSNGEEIDVTINGVGNYFLHVLSTNLAGQSTETKKTISSYANYHTHIGDATHGGACYQTPNYHQHVDACYSKTYHKHTSSCNATATCTVTYSRSSASYGPTKCASCGASGTKSGTTYYYYENHSSCGQGKVKYDTRTKWNCTNCGAKASAPAAKSGSTTHSYDTGGYKCGKTTSTVESSTIICGKDGQIESYSLSCGKDENTVDSYTISY